MARGADRLAALLQRGRVYKYRALSNCKHVSGSPVALQPVLLLGEGAIVLGRDVEFGWPASALFHTGYCHIEASTPGSVIEFGDGVQLNNNAFVKSEGRGSGSERARCSGPMWRSLTATSTTCAPTTAATAGRGWHRSSSARMCSSATG